MNKVADTFIINYQGNNILYDSLLNISSISDENLSQLENEQYDNILKKNGFLHTLEDNKKSIENDYLPNSATIIPTLGCNFSCTYCFSTPSRKEQYLEIEKATAAIDYIVDNSIKKNKRTKLVIHGGGEPLTATDLVVEISKYFRSVCKEKNVKGSVLLCTNGFASEKNLDLIKDTIDIVQISCDGPEQSHDSQRVTVNGQKTYKTVLGTIDYFENNKIPYIIRTTVTQNNLHSLNQWVESLKERELLRILHLEPFLENSTSKSNGLSKVKSNDFFDIYVSIDKTLLDSNIKLTYSGCSERLIKTEFCNISNHFILTPEGIVTSCLESIDSNCDNSDIFILGSIDAENKIDINKEKQSFLTQRKSLNIEACSKCIAKFKCAGDCSKNCAGRTGDIMTIGESYRCDINRSISVYNILKSCGLLNGECSYVKIQSAIIKTATNIGSNEKKLAFINNNNENPDCKSCSHENDTGCEAFGEEEE